MPLRGLLREMVPFPPLYLRFPPPQSGSVPRKFGTFFFFNQWEGGGGKRVKRSEERVKDKDRDRTGNNGSHKERK